MHVDVTLFGRVVSTATTAHRVRPCCCRLGQPHVSNVVYPCECDLRVRFSRCPRDPIHDFGLFRFDPTTVRFMKLKEIQLSPQEAHVGCEIRVIGVRTFPLPQLQWCHYIGCFDKCTL